METIEIIIVDDHKMFAEGLKHIIESAGNMRVTGSAHSVNEAYRMICNKKPQLVIIDVDLDEGYSGIELVNKLSREMTDLKCLFLSAYDEDLYAERAIRAGAFGYIMKKECSAALIKAIRLVMSNEIYLSRKMASRVLKNIIRKEINNKGLLDILSNREFEIFRLIGEGNRTSEIAKLMNLSIKTIDSHRQNIRKKLNLKNSSELIKYAVHWVHQ